MSHKSGGIDALLPDNGDGGIGGDDCSMADMAAEAASTPGEMVDV